MAGNMAQNMIQLDPAGILQSEDNDTQTESNTGNATSAMAAGTIIDLPGVEEECKPILPEADNDNCIASEEIDGNQTIATELTANSRRKTMIHKKRLSAMGITKAEDSQILSQEMFVSIANNQFKWNGKGSFGTFLF